MWADSVVVDISVLIRLHDQQQLENLLHQETLKLTLSDGVATCLTSLGYEMTQAINVHELSRKMMIRAVNLRQTHPEISWLNIQSLILAADLPMPLLTDDLQMIPLCQMLLIEKPSEQAFHMIKKLNVE